MRTQIWFCGGGTQSCAIAALILDGKLPKPDLAVIADTGREKATTWSYLESVLKPKLAMIGLQVERVAAAEYGYGGTALFSRTGELLIPAFSSATSGSTAKLPAFCNRWWKQDSMRVYLSRVHGVTRSKYCSWVGFSFDEQRRWFRMMQGQEYQKGLLWFPLVDLRLKRGQAINIVLQKGWPMPPRSACWMCPNQGDDEWRDLRDNSPAEFEQAVALDTAIRDRDPHAWLHKSCQPLSEVRFSGDAQAMPCDSGGCFL